MRERVVLVTGSTSGIGEATAVAFSRLGDAVVFNSAHSVEAGERLASTTDRSCYVQADVSNADDCARLVREVVQRFGRLDVLVNNAGTTRRIAHDDLAACDGGRVARDLRGQRLWDVVAERRRDGAPSRDPRRDRQRVLGRRRPSSAGSSIPYAASKAALNHMTALLAKVGRTRGAGERGRSRPHRHTLDPGLGRTCTVSSVRSRRSSARARPTTSPRSSSRSLRRRT